MNTIKDLRMTEMEFVHWAGPNVEFYEIQKCYRKLYRIGITLMDIVTYPSQLCMLHTCNISFRYIQSNFGPCSNWSVMTHHTYVHSLYITAGLLIKLHPCWTLDNPVYESQSRCSKMMIPYDFMF